MDFYLWKKYRWDDIYRKQQTAYRVECIKRNKEVDFINGEYLIRALKQGRFGVYNKATGATFSNANANEYMLSTNPQQNI
jgi:hypothetical protein